LLSAAVRRSAVAATLAPSGNNSIYLARTRPDSRSIGGENEDQGLWRSIDDGGTAVLELNSVVLLIGRKEGAVHEHAAVNEFEAPVASAFEDSRHVFSPGGVARARRQKPSRSNTPVQRLLFCRLWLYRPARFPTSPGGGRGASSFASASFFKSSCLSCTFFVNAFSFAISSAECCLRVGNSRKPREPRVQASLIPGGFRSCGTLLRIAQNLGKNRHAPPVLRPVSLDFDHPGFGPGPSTAHIQLSDLSRRSLGDTTHHPHQVSRWQSSFFKAARPCAAPPVSSGAQMAARHHQPRVSGVYTNLYLLPTGHRMIRNHAMRTQ